MALNFPSSPVDGQEYDNYYWEAASGIWRRKTSAQQLNDLNDVDAASPNDGDVLTYDNASGNWEPKPSESPFATTFLLMGS